MEQHNAAFHTAEFQALREELMSNIKGVVTTLIYCITANALIVAWISGKNNFDEKYGTLILIAAFLPFLITILSWVIHRYRLALILKIATYIKTIEEKLAIDGHGWEHFLSSHKEHGILRVRYVYFALYALQLILSASLIVLVFRKYLFLI